MSTLSYTEIRIVRKMVEAMIQAGMTVSVFDGETFQTKRTADVKVVLDGLDGLEEAWLNVRLNDKLLGRVYLVFGEGADVVADWHESLDAQVQPAVDYAQKFAR